MTSPRPIFADLASRFDELDIEPLVRIIQARLLRMPLQELPSLGRDEDPADVLIDLAEWRRERGSSWASLLEASARIASLWADLPEVRTQPEPVGELHYLCARIGAIQARHGIAQVVRRADLRGILLATGEHLQHRALRCLTGLLARVPQGERSEFLPLFNEALSVPQHLSIALTALVAFDRDRRDRHVALARESWPLHVEEALVHLERNVALLREEML